MITTTKNEQIAKHLNRLLYLRNQLVIPPSAACGQVHFAGNLRHQDQGLQAIQDRLEAEACQLIEAKFNACLEAEIRAAAAESREVKGWKPINPSSRQWTWNGNLAGHAAYDAALPGIQALCEASNAERVARYEAYRIACEQGVAVPPMEPAPADESDDEE